MSAKVEFSTVFGCQVAQLSSRQLDEALIKHEADVTGWGFCSQTPTFNSTLKGRVLLDLFTEPDIFGIKWDALNLYNGVLYPALPDLYGPTMNVRPPDYSY